MSNSEQFGGSRPFRITTYTSGTGTFTPTVSNSWCRITLVGAGAGGRRGATVTAGGGGGGGHTRRVWMQVAGALTYSVGAAGAGATADNTYGTAGGSTSLGNLVAQGGRVPTGTGAGGQGGGGAGGVVDGCGGGGGQPGSPGYMPGHSASSDGTAWPTGAAAGTTSTNGGGGGGGSSDYGSGGAGGNGAAGAASAGANATGYGGGGGGGGGGSTSGNGGNGTGGYLLIEEFGA